MIYLSCRDGMKFFSVVFSVLECCHCQSIVAAFNLEITWINSRSVVQASTDIFKDFLIFN